MTPPNVPETPKPWSSVMMSSTFGAPFGGTTRGGHHGFESLASSLITPPNGADGGGNCLPSIVVVALGEPGVPVTCCANKEPCVRINATNNAAAQWVKSVCRFNFMVCEGSVGCWFDCILAMSVVAAYCTLGHHHAAKYIDDEVARAAERKQLDSSR